MFPLNGFVELTQTFLSLNIYTYSLVIDSTEFLCGNGTRIYISVSSSCASYSITIECCDDERTSEAVPASEAESGDIRLA